MPFSTLCLVCGGGMLFCGLLEFCYIYGRVKDKLWEEGIDAFALMRDEDIGLREKIENTLDEEYMIRRMFRIASLLILIRFVYCVIVGGYI